MKPQSSQRLIRKDYLNLFVLLLIPTVAKNYSFFESRRLQHFFYPVEIFRIR